MTLEDCRGLLARRSAALRRAELRASARAAELLRAERALAPTLRMGASYRTERVPTTSTFIDPSGIYERRAGRFDTAIIGDLPTGAHFELLLREEVGSITAQSVSLSPFYTTTLGLELRQPFLQGLGRPGTSIEIQRARHALAVASQQAREEISALEAELERRYWLLARAERRLGVVGKLRELAERRLGLAARALAQGRTSERDQRLALADLDRAGGQELVARRERDVAEQRLLAYVVSPDDVLGSAARLPALEAVSEPPASPPAVEVLPAAVTSHPRVLRLEHQVHRWEREAEQARDRGRARLDAVTRVGSVGLAGQSIAERRGLPVPPDRLVGGFGQSFSNALSDRFLAFEVGLELTLPLGAVFSAGSPEEARIELERTRRELELARVEVALGLREAAVSLAAEQRRVGTLAREVDQVAQRLEAERLSLQGGHTDALGLIEVERAHLEAQLRLIDARFEVVLRAVELTHGPVLSPATGP